MDRIVPVPMEAVMLQLNLRHELVRHFSSFRIAMLVELAANTRSCCRARRCYQTDDYCQAYQGLTSPIRADVGEKAVLDLVPLAGPRREMTDRNR